MWQRWLAVWSFLGKRINPFTLGCDCCQVQDLKYATLATVSRCGMVWFSEDVLSTEMIFENYMLRLRNLPLEESEDELGSFKKPTADPKEDELSPTLQVSVVDAESSEQAFIRDVSELVAHKHLYRMFQHTLKHCTISHYIAAILYDTTCIGRFLVR